MSKNVEVDAAEKRRAKKSAKWSYKLMKDGKSFYKTKEALLAGYKQIVKDIKKDSGEDSHLYKYNKLVYKELKSLCN